jgi:hypothetical protein
MNYTQAINQLRRIRFGRRAYLPRDPDDRAKIIQERLDLLKTALTQEPEPDSDDDFFWLADRRWIVRTFLALTKLSDSRATS